MFLPQTFMQNGHTLSSYPQRISSLCQNMIRQHHSLAIEGNELSEEQITAILENKRVLGPEKQIMEVQNALKVYDSLMAFNPTQEKHLLKAHKLLMQGLFKNAGKYRTGQVGILKGTKVSHVAPPAKNVPHLMGELFSFLQKDHEISVIIKACVFHYELEFIHPFEDGNGRMGRLWQQLLLMKHSPVFEYISTETLIHKKQMQYYSALEKSDKAGDSTAFLEFSLEVILAALNNFKANQRPPKASVRDRIHYALEHFGESSFSRKIYMELFPEISTATASRDLALAVREQKVTITGEKAEATYKASRPK
ncbi:Fic family protein [Bdellovibrio bacteriovorus]|uniref:Fic family protein n=1 Tax=Bdellovibrio bacteriovorus TaxID=959 RepID=UPI0021D05B3E|nr:Fic family protein [Bdellovibrio bacteriovorus]UXR65349.1 Fic family protein [Bdellovibrio bacteriovorus]